MEPKCPSYVPSQKEARERFAFSFPFCTNLLKGYPQEAHTLLGSQTDPFVYVCEDIPLPEFMDLSHVCGLDRFSGLRMFGYVSTHLRSEVSKRMDMIVDSGGQKQELEAWSPKLVQGPGSCLVFFSGV